MKKSALIISILLTFVLAFSGCNTPDTGSTTTTEKGSTDEINTAAPGVISLPCAADDALTLIRMYSYSGKFVEDASFEEKENVAAIEVLNASGTDIRLARIIVTTKTRELLFEATSIPGYNTITVLEKNAAAFTEGEEIIGVRVENRVDFEEDMSFHKESISIMTTGYVFNVENITDKDIESDIYIYYKKIDGNGKLFGGITFRSKVEGLKAGELRQVAASNFISEDSKVIFVEYAGL